MVLKPGTISDFSHSMAQAMEDAFHAHWTPIMGDRPIPIDSRHLRLLFVAIAQGVVAHLQAHPEAFQVEVDLPDAGGTADGEVTEIR